MNILVLGAEGVGKSSWLYSLATGEFQPEQKIGYDTFKVEIETMNGPITIQFDEFPAMSSEKELTDIIRNYDGAIILFDQWNWKSALFYTKLWKQYNPGPVILCASKNEENLVPLLTFEPIVKKLGAKLSSISTAEGRVMAPIQMLIKCMT